MFGGDRKNVLVAQVKKSRALRELEAYWEALRPSDGIPDRSTVRPDGLLNVLDVTFILERVAPGVSRFRLAGHKIGDFLGVQAENVPLTALFIANNQQEVAATVEKVFTQPAILKADLVSIGSLGRPKINAEMALYPLKDGENGITRALGAISFQGRIGRSPRQFHEVQISLTRPVVTYSTSQYPQKLEHKAAYETSANLIVHQKRRPVDTSRPKLRVIQGDKS